MLVRDNKYIPQEDKDFFILLRIGLWQKVEEELSPTPDWEYIYLLSCEQTVQGIVSDGIEIYKTVYSCNISEEANDKFLSSTANIICGNLTVNALQAKLCQLFDEKAIQYVVLKGQAVGQLYPKPTLRCSGDIDFLFKPKDFEKLKQITTPFTDEEMTGNRPMSRYGFRSGDTYVELHTNVFLESNKLHVYLNQKQKELFDSNNYSILNIGNYPVKSPTNDFVLPFLFYHILKHLFNEGIGLRQLCDFAVCYNNYYSSTEAPNKKEYIDDVLYARVWSQIYSFLVYNLGVARCLDLQVSLTSEKEANKIWSACKQSGNFGKKLKRYYGEGFWKRNSALFKTIIRTYYKNRKINSNMALEILKNDIENILKIVFKKIFKKN